MATRKANAKDAMALTDEARYALCYGPDHFPAGMTMRTAKATWMQHRAEILNRWIELNPGCRPWAWWQHDCPADVRAMRFDDEAAAARVLAERGLLTTDEESIVQSGKRIRAIAWLAVADAPDDFYQQDFLSRQGRAAN